MAQKPFRLRRGSCIATAAQALLVAGATLLPAACAPGGGSTIEPPVPGSNVTPDMLNPDGTFKKNGLAPVDPNQQI